MPIDLVIEDREGVKPEGGDGSPPGIENHDSRGPPEQVRRMKKDGILFLLCLEAI